MTSIPAPKKFSNFPFANTLTNSMRFLVADANTGLNYQLTSNVLLSFVSSALLPVQTTQITLSTQSFNANTLIDQSYNGKVLYYNGNTDVTISFANNITDPFRLDIVNLSSVSNVNIDYSSYSVLSPAVITTGWVSLMKVANTFVGRT